MHVQTVTAATIRRAASPLRLAKPPGASLLSTAELRRIVAEMVG